MSIIYNKYNEQAFTPEEVEQGLLNDLINYLLNYNKKNKDCYYDIHIDSDGYCTIVEWINRHYDSQLAEGEFKFVNEDEVIMIEKNLPDNSIIVVYTEEEYQERLKEWLEENPGWKKNEYGHWYNEKENDLLRDSLGLSD